VLKIYEIGISLTGDNDNFEAHKGRVATQIFWHTRTPRQSLFLLGEYFFFILQDFQDNDI